MQWCRIVRYATQDSLPRSSRCKTSKHTCQPGWAGKDNRFWCVRSSSFTIQRSASLKPLHFTQTPLETEPSRSIGSLSWISAQRTVSRAVQASVLSCATRWIRRTRTSALRRASPATYQASIWALYALGHIGDVCRHPPGIHRQRGATQYGIVRTVADGPVPPRAEMRAWHELVRRTATCRERHCAIHSIHHAAQHRSVAPTAAGAERVQRPRSVCSARAKTLALSSQPRCVPHRVTVPGGSATARAVCGSAGRSNASAWWRRRAFDATQSKSRAAPARTRQYPGRRLLALSVRRVPLSTA